MSAEASSAASSAGGAVNPAALDQAVNWFVRLASGQADARDRDALAQWRKADPEHERAWQQLQGVGQKLRGSADLVQAPAARAALSNAAAVNRRRALKILTVAGAVGTAALWTREQSLWTPWTADYHSGVGERRSVVLADGTQVLLNTATAMDVHFDAGQRRLILRGGEVRVATAADPAKRPFLVATRDGTLRPIGTRFTVRRLDDDSATLVAVSEGAVEVRSAADAASVVVVQAGQQTSFSSTTIHPPGPLDDAATAWTDGILTAERMRLEDFLAELSRYRQGRLRCDPAVADLRLTGTYPLNDTDHVLAVLQQTLPVRVNSYTRYWVTVTAR